MRRNRVLRWASMIALGGTVLQIGECTPSSFVSFWRNFNPCGSYLECDPVTYRFGTSGYRGPGVNPAIDPACTYPPYCPNDPFVAGGAQQP